MSFLNHLFEKRSRRKEAELADRLNTAIEKNDSAELERLFSKGADPHTKMLSGGNCLEAALFMRCNVDTVRTIVEAGIDLRACFSGFCHRPKPSEVAHENRCDLAVVQYLTDAEKLLNLKATNFAKKDNSRDVRSHNYSDHRRRRIKYVVARQCSKKCEGS